MRGKLDTAMTGPFAGAGPRPPLPPLSFLAGRASAMDRAKKARTIFMCPAGIRSLCFSVFSLESLPPSKLSPSLIEAQTAAHRRPPPPVAVAYRRLPPPSVSFFLRVEGVLCFCFWPLVGPPVPLVWAKNLHILGKSSGHTP